MLIGVSGNQLFRSPVLQKILILQSDGELLYIVGTNLQFKFISESSGNVFIRSLPVELLNQPVLRRTQRVLISGNRGLVIVTRLAGVLRRGDNQIGSQAGILGHGTI